VDLWHIIECPKIYPSYISRSQNMNDIKTRSDIESLIDKFYKKVLDDKLISSFFNDIVILDWSVHIPIMYDFWESTLLGAAKYKRNAMLKHIELNKKKALKPEHFERWIDLWAQTVRENFSGTIADDAIFRANSIGELMKFKIGQTIG